VKLLLEFVLHHFQSSLAGSFPHATHHGELYKRTIQKQQLHRVRRHLEYDICSFLSFLAGTRLLDV
jgi:hypothetical protein